jgi:ParB-like chromosome segregation protein Spo0J
LNIKKIDIGLLISPDYNPRKKLTKNDDDYKKIEKSINKFGYVDPIILNSDYTIIGSNQRYQVLKDLGYKNA